MGGSVNKATVLGHLGADPEGGTPGAAVWLTCA